VEALFQAHDRTDRLLDQPAVEHVEAEMGARWPGDAVALDFLSPSAKPGSLGRLGHYEVLEVVGKGGMGIVLRAFDEKLHRVVAIKVLAPEFARDNSARQRFVREARAAAAVTHDNVIAIHGVENDGPIPYLIMQFIEGRTLQEKLDRTGPLPVKDILRLGIQIADGLAAAHRHGLVHRDVKPANILLENGIERVKITDFGLARTVDDASVTQSGFIVGTPEYMSPEQANGKKVDSRSDLFSLGSVLYTLCAGRPPFHADTSFAVMKRVCDESPKPMRGINPDIPEWLEATIARLHSKSPSARFATARDVADLLSRGLTQLQAGAGPSTLSPLDFSLATHGTKLKGCRNLLRTRPRGSHEHR
jgi:serine/threonine protein kinase